MTSRARPGVIGLFLALTLMSIAVAPRALAQGGNHAGDHAALMALFNAAGGPNWKDNTYWGTDLALSRWFGVTTDDSGRVTRLNLSDNGLNGEMPPDLGNLSNLEELDFYMNELRGRIPPELGRLTKLRDVFLGYNELSGEIPPELGNLAELDRLWLFRNQLSGQIPPELGNLSSLRLLSLDRNKLSGEIPRELSKLSSLVGLSLYTNELSGEVPAELGNLSNLTSFHLSGNRLSGEVLRIVARLTKMTKFSVDDNQFSGQIPPELGKLTNLSSISISRNRFSGEIPAELGNLAKLRTLYMYGNELSGELPLELGYLVHLFDIRVSGNALSGCVPYLLWHSPTLTVRSTGSMPACPRIAMREGDSIPVQTPILAARTNVDTENVTVVELGGAVNGSVHLDGDIVRYEHDGSETTVGGFTYTITDGATTATREAVVDVVPVNDPPVGATDRIGAHEGGAVSVHVSQLLANDFDVDSPTFRLTGVGGAANGSVRLERDTITYVHDGSETTVGGFTYTLTDGSAEGTGEVVVDVTPVNDPPVAVGDRFGVDEGAALLLDVLANDIDVDGDTLRLVEVGGAVNGSLHLDGDTIRYEHDGSETTSDGFTYTLTDGSVEATAQVVVDVTPVNDPPVAVADRTGVDEGGAVSVDVSVLLANDTDVDSESFRITAVGGAVNGSVWLDGDTIHYEHDGSETTAGGFTYTVNDGSADATGEVVVDVAPVNDPPIAAADRTTVDEGGTVSLQVSELLANDTDVDSETFAFTGVGGAVNGTVRLDGAIITYEHDGSQTAAGGFTYTITDGSLEATGEVIAAVAPVNDAPVAVADGTGVDEGGTVSLDASALLANDFDVDGDTLRVTAVGGAVNGSVRLDGATITYEHDGSETVTGGFTYTITDGRAEETAEVVVDVAPVNDPPVAVADRARVDEGGTVSLHVWELVVNDSDVDSPSLSVTGVSGAVNGSVQL